MGITRSIVELTNGELLMFGSDSSWYAGHEPPPRELLGVSREWYREGSQGMMAMRSAWRIRSQDGGQTWSEREHIIEQDVRIDGKTDWPALQPFFRQASIVQLSDDLLLAATRRAEPERMVLVESTDGGKHWTEARDFLAAGEIHAHLLALSDGRVLCTYARQELPRGIFAVLSSDRGKTWDVDHPAHLAGSLAEFFGWPTSIEMTDGTILTSYTIKGYEETTQINDSATEVVRWPLPGAEGVHIEPETGPVFAEKHDYARYPSGVTGFTGRSLQKVAFWQCRPAQRSHIPGYKGAISRFPSGQLLACPAVQESGGRYSTIYRSTDEGVSWQKVQMQGDRVPGKEQAMLCLRDGKTVLLQTEASDEVLFRSADGGVTWRRIEYGQTMPITRNFVQLSDGSILKFGFRRAGRGQPGAPRATAWRLRSRDGGLTWPEREEVSTWESPEVFFGEVCILALSDSDFLAATRVSGDAARAMAGAPPIAIGAGAGGETDEGMVLMESQDAGLTWSPPRWFLEYSAVHAHLTKLADGRILCMYRRRFLPFGVAGVLSNDNGRTWDTDHPILLGVRPTAYGGWPTSIQLPDGTILTSRAYMTWPDATFEVVRWQLPPAC